ncbi:MAG: M56 family metallopeptidase, partial [Bacteroides sp.]|nr:M56 family metallopeptidase [Bacteroides sp.]
MAPEWIYLLKVNVGIALFYAFYKLFCQRDTFFQWRRYALLSFLGISFLYPLIDIQNWVKEQPAMNELAEYYATWMMDETLVVTPTAAPQLPSLMTIGMYIYLVGVIALSLRFIVQLLSICRMRWNGKVVYRNGHRIISLPSETNPFSFFGWIFLYLPQLEKESEEEILTHEQTHARQWHSIDVIISEIINIICWFNPFSWLMKTEIRLNLEYLADNQVAETIHDCKQYQYHLLGLAHTKKETGLCNNFNVSHLKRRIIMMNKKRTRTAGRIKYALFVPLAVALLLASNISCTSTEKKNEQVASKEKPEVKFDVEEDYKAQDSSENVVFQVVEEMPEFPGGMAECMKFLNKNIKYPTISQENGVQGRVIVQFVVTKDGDIAEPKVVRGVDPYLDAEALRVISMMPKWKPGKQRGEAVNVKYTVPVMFRLQGGDSSDTKEMEETEANKDPNGIHQVVEEMPEFPGGMRECMNFLSKNIKYPATSM